MKREYAMFYKYNSYVFNKVCRYTILNRWNHTKNHSKKSKKSAATNKSSDVNEQDRIDRFPASEYDKCNYLMCNSMANSQIQAVLKFDGRLDFDKLQRAVRLSIDVEPVLGCRYVEDEPQYWSRLDNIDEITFCSLEESDNADEAIKRFLGSPLDEDNDSMVKVKIIRSGEFDTLGLKIDYACYDAIGVKDYIQLLSDIYSRIDKEDDDFIPQPRMFSSKDQDRLYKELGITFSELRYSPNADTPNNLWEFPWIQRGEPSIRFALCRIPQHRLASIYQYGKSRDAAVNDLILTAFYRTMFKITKPVYGVPMDISSAVDLRQYIPEHNAKVVRSLSGCYVTRIARIKNESFGGTLSRVVSETQKIKESHMSVENSINIGCTCVPGLSDLGDVSKSLIRFGDNVASDAYIIPSVIGVPGFLLSASSYNDVLTMSIGYCKGSISQRDMDDVLNMIKNELMRGCGCQK